MILSIKFSILRKIDINFFNFKKVDISNIIKLS